MPAARLYPLDFLSYPPVTGPYFSGSARSLPGPGTRTCTRTRKCRAVIAYSSKVIVCWHLTCELCYMYIELKPNSVILQFAKQGICSLRNTLHTCSAAAIILFKCPWG